MSQKPYAHIWTFAPNLIDCDPQTGVQIQFLRGGIIGQILPKFAIARAFFGFWAQIFFGGLNQKSATISMCKIHIYIDSESFRNIR